MGLRKLEGYNRHPLPDQIPIRDREDAMGAYLMMFAAVAVALPLPIINLIAAIVYYTVNRRKSAFVHFRALQSLPSQFPTTLLNWGLLFWCLQICLFDNVLLSSDFWVFVALVVVANVVYYVFSILAALKAYKGEMYYFVGLGDYCYNSVFKSENRP